jgi:hypothetical protein
VFSLYFVGDWLRLGLDSRREHRVLVARHYEVNRVFQVRSCRRSIFTAYHGCPPAHGLSVTGIARKAMSAAARTLISKETNSCRSPALPPVRSDDCSASDSSGITGAFGAGIVSIEQLGVDGNDIAAESSRFLHVRPDEVTRWVVEERSGNRRQWNATFSTPHG